jgi:hypothetical protein
MANSRQKRLRKMVQKWYRIGKAKGEPMPGHGKRTNVGDPPKNVK